MNPQAPKNAFDVNLPPESDASPDPASRPPKAAFELEVTDPLGDAELRPPVPTSDASKLQVQAPLKRARLLPWLGGFGLAFLVLVAGMDAFRMIQQELQQNVLLGSALAVSLAGVLLTLLLLVGREVRDYRALNQVGQIRVEAEAALTEPGQTHALRLVKSFGALYGRQPLVQRRLAQFEQGLADHHSNAEVLHRFARVVIKPMDDGAYAIINRYAVDTAIVTAISPFAALDMLLSLWRNTRMIRAIAEHYGMRPGTTGSLTILKYVLQNLATAGASHYVSDALAESLGSDLVGKLSRRISEGAINGLMSVRLGLMAAEQCRPLPFLPEDKHSFRRLFRNVRKRQEEYAAANHSAD